MTSYLDGGRAGLLSHVSAPSPLSAGIKTSSREAGSAPHGSESQETSRDFMAHENKTNKILRGAPLAFLYKMRVSPPTGDGAVLQQHHTESQNFKRTRSLSHHCLLAP
ncbi:hypothetical protein EYF80_029123 [Liparis tanakae]|uniref:Uncharacterized protein n=1 Tax=Liparis tanakae TaxID=230148 RepID=A0A4Z2H583_9TELE|nr:hypothetical protein EYF80_029123 [Liparis tanakae]